MLLILLTVGLLDSNSMNVFSSVRVDQAGVICKQEGIFRVNCMDCLDRTNVVQAAFARAVMEQQVRSHVINYQMHNTPRGPLVSQHVCFLKPGLQCAFSKV